MQINQTKYIQSIFFIIIWVFLQFITFINDLFFVYFKQLSTIISSVIRLHFKIFFLFFTFRICGNFYFVLILILSKIIFWVFAVLACFTLARLWTLDSTIVTLTIFLETVGLFAVTSFLTETAWMQTYNTFFLDHDLGLIDLFLMLRSIFTRIASALACTG